MEKRKKEFAVIQSYGASKMQIYKIVFSETIVLLLTSVVWGLFIGIGLAYLFNPFFEFFAFFTTPRNLTTGYTLERILIFDLPNLIAILTITFLTMIFATYLSVRGAIGAKISTELREL